MGIAELSIDEMVHVDPEILSGLFARLGQIDAEQAITTAMEQSMARLCSIQNAVIEGNASGAAQLCDGLAELAGQVGMTTYQRVARDVADCARVCDAVALSATLSRLHRIGDKSILAVWGIEDLSG